MLSITNGSVSGNANGGGIRQTGSSASNVSNVTINGNIGYGILISGAGSLDATVNTITANSLDGIGMDGTGVGSHFNSNTIHSNGELAIDLLNNGVTANDLNDTDTGPNALQNFPVINYVRRGTGTAGLANFTLNAANGSYRIQFYANTACDASGNGEGEVLLASQTITVAGNTFTGLSTAPLAYGTREQITATATHDVNNNGNFDDDGNTSEFSACRKVNTLPTIAAQANSRQEGSPVSNSQIATVDDPDQTENTLAVTVGGAASQTVNGVTVSNIAVSAAGIVTADIVAACGATNANFTLRVTDNATEFNEAMLTVTVTPNTAPTVGTYSNTSLQLGGGTTVTPSAAPADNGSITGATVTAPGVGTLTIAPATGIVTIASATPAGVHTVTVTFTDNCGAQTTRQFTLTILAPPTIAKAFSPTSIPVGGTSTVTLTLTNANVATALTNASFTDALTNMTALGGSVTGTCGGTTPNTLTAGATALSFTGITIPANGACTVIFDVTSSTPGNRPNATSGLTTTQTPIVGTASNTAILTVVAPPTITKAFLPTTILQNNGFSTMTISLTNPAANTVALTGVGVVDNFPAGTEVDAPPTATNSCATGTFAPVAAATSVTVSGATIPVNTTCNFTVRVRGTSAGAKLNTTQNVTSANGGNGLTASATLTVTNTATWNGATSANWDTNTNWTPQTVPNSGNDVDIPTGSLPNEPTISAADVTVSSLTESAPRILTINAGRVLTVTNACTINGTMNVAGAFTCGTLTSAGTINFTGAAAQNVPAGTYNNFGDSNGAGVTLTGNTIVNGVLTLNGGNLNTGVNLLTIGPSGTISRTAGHILGNVEKIFAATGAFTYHVGTATGYSPLAVNITALATNPSNLRVTANDGTAPASPALSDALTLDRYWTLTETGDLTANLLFTYLQADVDGTESSYRTIRVTGGTAQGLPNGTSCPGAGSPCVDTAANTIFVGGVTAFSDWTAGVFSPTAGDASISGRVMDSAGRGVYRASVVMSDQDGNIVYAATNPFGYYRFKNVETGRSYILEARSKRHRFQSRVVTANDDVVGLDFVAEP